MQLDLSEHPRLADKLRDGQRYRALKRLWMQNRSDFFPALAKELEGRSFTFLDVMMDKAAEKLNEKL